MVLIKWTTVFSANTPGAPIALHLSVGGPLGIPCSTNPPLYLSFPQALVHTLSENSCPSMGIVNAIGDMPNRYLIDGPTWKTDRKPVACSLYHGSWLTPFTAPLPSKSRKAMFKIFLLIGRILSFPKSTTLFHANSK